MQLETSFELQNKFSLIGIQQNLGIANVLHNAIYYFITDITESTIHAFDPKVLL